MPSAMNMLLKNSLKNYDYIIQIVRGGNPNVRPTDIRRDAYISASDFKTAHDLGRYLKDLSTDTKKYASMLQAIDEYETKTYMELFKEAACDICRRLPSPEKYQSVYRDINEWIKTREPCPNQTIWLKLRNLVKYA